MQEFLLGATFVDFIVALVALEAGALLIWRAVTGRGPSPLPLLSNLLSGAFLLLALRNALSGASSVWVAACLLASLVAHLADLRLRWEHAASDAACGHSSANIKATISLRVPASFVRPSAQAKRGESVEG
jgi:hypothetical protein